MLASLRHVNEGLFLLIVKLPILAYTLYIYIYIYASVPYKAIGE